MFLYCVHHPAKVNSAGRGRFRGRWGRLFKIILSWRKKNHVNFINPKTLHRNNRKGKRQLLCCFVVVSYPMEFMFIIFIHLWLRLHTITNKESHTVMPQRFSHFPRSLSCFSGVSIVMRCTRNNVISFFKFTISFFIFVSFQNQLSTFIYSVL